MPITTVYTNIDRTEVHAALAKAVADQMAEWGLAANHVATRVVLLDSAHLYVGGEAYQDCVGAEVGFAFVEVAASRSRSDEQREALARAVVEALGGTVPRTRITIDFVAREAEDVYLGGRAVARRAAGAKTVTRPPNASPVRQVLVENWGQHVLEAPPEATLGSLFPYERGEFDSVDAEELGALLEEVLSLPPGALPTDTDGGQQLLGADVELGVLEAHVHALLA